MQLLQINHLKKYYGDRLIFEMEHFRVYRGDRIGVVGLNGAGKTTLLQVLAGEIEVEEGSISAQCEVAYLKQFGEVPIDAEQKLLKELNIQHKLTQEKLSGGEEERLRIAHMFSQQAPLYLIDEPTANLDMQGIKLLKKKLSQIESMLIISHHKDILDTVCNKILEIENGQISLFSGNYTAYEQQKKHQFETQKEEYEIYCAEKTHLERAIGQTKTKAKAVRKAPKRMGNSEARLHRREATETEEKLNRSAKTIQTRLKQLEVKEKPKELEALKLDFSLTNPPKNKIVLRGENLTFSYGEKQIFSDVSFAIQNGAHVALLGENGTGKTTLFRMIVQEEKGIRLVPKIKLGYFSQSFEHLDFEKTVLENVMETSVQTETVVRTILGRLLIKQEDVNKKITVLSGGERMKTAFAKLFVSDANMLLLDEPTNYLDLPSVEALRAVLKEYDGTILFVSHDRTFVQDIAKQLLFIENKMIRPFEGTLAEYENRQTQKPREKKAENKLLLEMRRTDLISRLSTNPQNAEALEEEYKSVLQKLREC